MKAVELNFAVEKVIVEDEKVSLFEKKAAVEVEVKAAVEVEAVYKVK